MLVGVLRTIAPAPVVAQRRSVLLKLLANEGAPPNSIVLLARTRPIGPRAFDLNEGGVLCRTDVRAAIRRKLARVRDINRRRWRRTRRESSAPRTSARSRPALELQSSAAQDRRHVRISRTCLHVRRLTAALCQRQSSPIVSLCTPSFVYPSRRYTAVPFGVYDYGARSLLPGNVRRRGWEMDGATRTTSCPHDAALLSHRRSAGWALANSPTRRRLHERQQPSVDKLTDPRLPTASGKETFAARELT